MSVHDAQAVGVHEAYDDPFGSKQLGDVGEKALVEDLRLLDAAAQPVDRDALPRREKLCELIDLIAKRDPLSVSSSGHPVGPRMPP